MILRNALLAIVLVLGLSLDAPTQGYATVTYSREEKVEGHPPFG